MNIAIACIIAVLAGFVLGRITVNSSIGRRIYRSLMPRLLVSRADFDTLIMYARRGAAWDMTGAGRKDVDKIADQAEGSL